MMALKYTPANTPSYSPNRYFLQYYATKVDSTHFKVGAVEPSYQGNYAFIYDNRKAGTPGDSNTQIGDVANDKYTYFISQTNTGSKVTGASQFVGGTADKGAFVGFVANFGKYYFYKAPGEKYMTGDTVTVSPSNAISLTACYAAGTLMRTARGDVAVEQLVAGDLVVTASGEHRPIRWLGHRTIDCRNHPRSRDVHPIRIAAHAFGPNKPARDLFVSPGHAICVDMLGEVLIPAHVMINGTTIRQVEVDEVTYWHVELDSHDILLAENLPAESYLEMGNRDFFQENDVTQLDATPDGIGAARTHADFCRPYLADGQLVDVVRSQLRRQALAAGWTLDTSEPFAGLHLLVDGQRVEAAHRGLAARFHVPAGAREIWLASKTSRPCDIEDSTDGRDLGVCLTRLAIDDGFAPPRELDIADPLLCVGFQHMEYDRHRWTAGRALIPAELAAGCPDGFFLCLELAGHALPRWVAPAESAPDSVVQIA